MQTPSLSLVVILASLTMLTMGACEVERKRIGSVLEPQLDAGDDTGNESADASSRRDGTLGGGLAVTLAASDTQGGTVCAGSCVTVHAAVSGGDGTYRFAWSDASLQGPGPHSYCPTDDTPLELEVSDESRGEFGPSSGHAALALAVRSCGSPSDAGGQDARAAGDAGWSSDGCIDIPHGGILTFCPVEPFGADRTTFAIEVDDLTQPGESYEFRQRGKLSASGTLSLWDGRLDRAADPSMNGCTVDTQLATQDFNVLVGEQEIPLVGCFRAKAGSNAVFVRRQAPLFGGGGYGGVSFALCKGCPSGTPP